MIGKLLRQIRQEEGLTLHKAEAITGVPNTHLSGIETGKRSVSDKKAAEIFKALGYILEKEYSIKKI